MYGPDELPASLLCDSFENACIYHGGQLGINDGTPLLDALYMRGGSKLYEAAEILLRAATASLLNASFHEVNHSDIYGPGDIVYFPLYSTPETCAALAPAGTDCSVTNVEDVVNAALASGERWTIIDLADLLDSYNNGIHDINWGEDGPLP